MTNIPQNLTINGINIDGVLEIRTRDHRMVDPDESTELVKNIFTRYIYLSDI